MTTTTVVAEDRVLTFGKYRNQMLSKVPGSYLRWLVSHSRVMAVRNRHYAVLAANLLAAREQEAEQAKKDAEMAVKAAEAIVSENKNWDDWAEVLEASKEEQMLKAIRATIGKRQIFEWQESLQKTILANKDVSFTADEMYEALESVCREGEDLDSKRDVTEYLNALVRMPFAPIRLEKVGNAYKAK